MGWKEEVEGIEPWKNAARFALRREAVPGLCRVHEPTGVTYHVHRLVEAPDLDDPDTLAAFDRRLALRLGAAEEDVREGVMCVIDGPPYHDECVLHVCAGGVVYTYGDSSLSWTATVPCHTDDPLLARVRAWKSANTKETE